MTLSRKRPKFDEDHGTRPFKEADPEGLQQVQSWRQQSSDIGAEFLVSQRAINSEQRG
jgi:hypothetical protein